MSQNLSQDALDYKRIEAAIHFLEENFHSQPSLQEIAKSIHVSEFHFQRLFSRWVGISPKQFLQYLTKEYAKKLLHRSNNNLLDVTYESGLSSPGRLHDLFVHFEAVTPGEFKTQGQNVRIEFGFHPSPFGECFLATTPRGICALSFVKRDRDTEIDDLRKIWENAELRENPDAASKVVSRIFASSNGHEPKPFHLFLKGTNFQIKVWEALLKIPFGAVVSYADVARYIGKPKAVRAVANAVGQNPVPFLIPCHRVIRKLGEFGGYGGGTARKKAMIGWEAAKSQPAMLGA
ncbi:methylated-DNA--[protein]-cysteine S-methyltransferase [bacterium]|nr:methylated-DNA--[protein]-cysteine S-methyltransferase [bacterium]